MKKNEVTTTENANEINTALTVVTKGYELPEFLPKMDKKELFNLIQDTKPLADLTDKPFKIIGLMPEIVEVPKSSQEYGAQNENPFDEDGEMVERLRLTLITDIGVFHSFSTTFHKALAKAIKVFGAEYTDNTYSISTKLKGSGASAKAFYVVKVV